MDVFLNKIMDFIIHNRKIDDEEAEIVRYGLEMAILKVTFFAAALVVSIFMNSFWQFIIFISLFSLLRSYAGGYHAQTRTRCFVQSILLIVAAIMIINITQKITYIIVPLSVIALAAGIIIWRIAPVDSKNKRLESDEKFSLRRKTRITLIAEVIIGIVSYILNFKIVSCAVTLSITASCVLLLAEYLKTEQVEDYEE